jgi:nucleoid-associated protein YgaU
MPSHDAWRSLASLSRRPCATPSAPGCSAPRWRSSASPRRPRLVRPPRPAQRRRAGRRRALRRRWPLRRRPPSPRHRRRRPAHTPAARLSGQSQREARGGGGVSVEGRPKLQHQKTTRAEQGRARRSSATGPSAGDSQGNRRPDRASGSSDRSGATRKTRETAGVARPHGHAGGQLDVRAEARGTYRVQAGDSLWRIAARRLGGDASDAQTAREVNRLWQLNQQQIGTGDPDLIFPGQTLRM